MMDVPHSPGQATPGSSVASRTWTGPSSSVRAAGGIPARSARPFWRGVGAAGAGPDGPVEVRGGGRGAVADLGDRRPDGAGDVDPGAFGFRAEAPGPAAEAGRGGELAN